MAMTCREYRDLLWTAYSASNSRFTRQSIVYAHIILTCACFILRSFSPASYSFNANSKFSAMVSSYIGEYAYRSLLAFFDEIGWIRFLLVVQSAFQHGKIEFAHSFYCGRKVIQNSDSLDYEFEYQEHKAILDIHSISTCLGEYSDPRAVDKVVAFGNQFDIKKSILYAFRCGNINFLRWYRKVAMKNIPKENAFGKAPLVCVESLIFLEENGVEIDGLVGDSQLGSGIRKC